MVRQTRVHWTGMMNNSLAMIGNVQCPHRPGAAALGDGDTGGAGPTSGPLGAALSRAQKCNESRSGSLVCHCSRVRCVTCVVVAWWAPHSPRSGWVVHSTSSDTLWCGTERVLCSSCMHAHGHTALGGHLRSKGAGLR